MKKINNNDKRCIKMMKDECQFLINNGYKLICNDFI